jgi:hypothetical protein
MGMKQILNLMSMTDRARAGGRAAAVVIRAKAGQRAADLAGVVTEIRAAGITSFSAVAREMNARGVSTPRGGRWNSATAARLLKRLDDALSEQVKQRAALALVVELRAAGIWSLTAIIRSLTANGFPAPNYAKVWSKKQVLRLLDKAMDEGAELGQVTA